MARPSTVIRMGAAAFDIVQRDGKGNQSQVMDLAAAAAHGRWWHTENPYELTNKGHRALSEVSRGLCEAFGIVPEQPHRKPKSQKKPTKAHPLDRDILHAVA